MAESVALWAVGIGLSYASVYLNRKKDHSVLTDDNPTTEVTRGAFLPVVIGRHRIAPLIAYVSDPEQMASDEATGKRQLSPASTPAGPSYRAQAIHLICLGPTSMISKVWINGQEFTANWSPISAPAGVSVRLAPDNTYPIPSGGVISGSIGTAGFFADVRVYWGQRGEPADFISPLGSSLPLATKLVFDYAYLGSVKQWPLIEYEVVNLPISSLIRTPPWKQASAEDSSTLFSHPISSSVGGSITVRYVQLALPLNVPFDRGDLVFPHASIVRLVGPDATTFFGVSVAYAYVWKTESLPGHIIRIYIGHQVIPEIQEILHAYAPGSLSGRTITPIPFYPDGVNHAHAIYHLLFNPAPFGGGRDPGDFDLESLERVGETLQEEGLICNMRIEGGSDLSELLSNIMQDIGMLIPLNPVTGKYEFRLVRETDVITMSSDHIVGPLPEVRTRVMGPKEDRFVFSFNQRTRDFKNGTYLVDDDGRATEDDAQRARVLTITSTTDFVSTQKIAVRRAHNESVQYTATKFQAINSARKLIPGDVIFYPELPFNLRIVGVKPDLLSGKTDIACLADWFSVPELQNLPSGGEDSLLPSETIPNEGGLPLVPAQPNSDAMFGVLEASRFYYPKEIRLYFMRVRQSDTDSVYASVHLSRDDVTYTKILDNLKVVAGATLVSSVDNVTDDIDVTVAPVGPDFTDLVPAMLDSTNYSLGRLIVIIDQEVMFCSGYELNEDGSVTLNGLLRAKRESSIVAHSPGADVFLFQSHLLTNYGDILLEPGATIYVKTQPPGISLAEINPYIVVLSSDPLETP